MMRPWLSLPYFICCTYIALSLEAKAGLFLIFRLNQTHLYVIGVLAILTAISACIASIRLEFRVIAMLLSAPFWVAAIVKIEAILALMLHRVFPEHQWLDLGKLGIFLAASYLAHFTWGIDIRQLTRIAALIAVGLIPVALQVAMGVASLN